MSALTCALTCALLVAVCVAPAACRKIVRLPRSVWPIQYNLSIYTDITGRNFSGNVSIELDIRDDTSNITLHSRGLSLGQAQVFSYGESGKEYLNVTKQELVYDVLTLQLEQILPVGRRYYLHIPYQGIVSQTSQRGYYRLRTGQQDTDWMTGTVFEFDHARETFPCFDEPLFKAVYRVSMVHHVNFSALSNTPQTDRLNYDAGEEGWVIDSFEATPEMSSYLVAFSLHKYNYSEVTTDMGGPLRVYAPANQLKYANNTLSTAPRVMAFLSEYTMVPDPMNKVDALMVPRFQGALENWGLISFMPSALLYKPSKVEGENESRRVLNSKVVTHELAHTWFGNLVTPQWWSHLWLSEGAATFFTALFLDEHEPQWDQFTEDSAEYLTDTYYSNAIGTGRPMSHPVEQTKQLRSVSQAPYYKGFCLFRMLHFSLGTDKFRAGIRRYLSWYHYGTATPEQLYKSMEYSYRGKSLKELMQSWTYQEGLPVVTVQRSEGQLILSQESFSLNVLRAAGKNQSDDDADEVRWWVPVSLVTRSTSGQGLTRGEGQARVQGQGQAEAWFNSNMTLPDPAQPSEWLMINREAAGTYHVKYDKANLELIKEALANRSEEIPLMNKFQLIMDYGLFALAGTESLPEVLDLLDHLTEERHNAPWTAALRTYWRLDQRLKGTPSQKKLQARVQRLLAPQFSRLGMRSRRNDSLTTIRLRRQVTLYACLFRLKECVRKASKLFTRWSDQIEPDKVNPVPVESRLAVYCSVLRDSGETPWQFLRERALKTKDQTHRDHMFTALGCTQNITLLYSMVEDASSPKLTKHDFTKLLQGVIQYSDDIAPVLDFMNTSMAKLKSSSKKKLRWNQSMLRDLAQQINDPKQLSQLFKMASLNKSWTEKDRRQVEKIVEHNSLWRQNNKHVL